MWPDAEAALIAWLTPHLGVRVCTDTPADLDHAVPLLRLQRIGGGDDGFRLDLAVVDLDAFAVTRAGAADLATRARTALLADLPGSALPDVVFTSAATVAAPAWRPWASQAVTRIGATYAVRLHTRP
ncbi:hypothetical protein B7P34_06730 [Streptosporangium nondiastaticum]|uniref:Uncharacterized protein n=1 Tax=Streptosporangium nondiastaticum TaxID=35764 RepID=A0A9X7PIX2_9ACTN|nr:hypothetical protein [Streptosporangium nondiastaticum]PSJ29557.1 hypothetical protein B7P34_06730 [Streptosporangium nondiastaticum]